MKQVSKNLGILLVILVVVIGIYLLLPDDKSENGLVSVMSGALIGVGTVFVPKTDKEIGRIAMIQLALKYATPIAWFFTFIYLFSLSAALLFAVGFVLVQVFRKVKDSQNR